MATNPYYQKSGNPTNRAQAKSKPMRDEFAALQLAFDALDSLIRLGTYTPAQSLLSNCTGFTPSLFTWIKFGNFYIVTGNITINITTGGVSATFRFNPPAGVVPTGVCSGSVNAVTGGMSNAAVSAQDSTPDYIQCQFVPLGSGIMTTSVLAVFPAA